MKAPHPFEQYDYDEKLSFRDFTNWEFKSRPEYDFNNKVIYSSCFMQETPDSDIFGNIIRGAVFINCNLDNVIIPEGNTIIMEGGGSQKRFKNQNDGNDWEIDEENKPTRPVSYKIFIKRGLAVPQPNELPLQKTAEAVDWLKLKQ